MTAKTRPVYAVPMAQITNKFKDEYGRNAYNVSEGAFIVGRIVRMPKAYIEANPGRNYMTNDWRMRDDSNPEAGVRYHRTLDEAKARFIMEEQASPAQKAQVRYNEALQRRREIQAEMRRLLDDIDNDVEEAHRALVAALIEQGN